MLLLLCTVMARSYTRAQFDDALQQLSTAPVPSVYMDARGGTIRPSREHLAQSVLVALGRFESRRHHHRHEDDEEEEDDIQPFVILFADRRSIASSALFRTVDRIMSPLQWAIPNGTRKKSSRSLEYYLTTRDQYIEFHTMLSIIESRLSLMLRYAGFYWQRRRKNKRRRWRKRVVFYLRPVDYHSDELNTVQYDVFFVFRSDALNGDRTGHDDDADDDSATTTLYRTREQLKLMTTTTTIPDSNEAAEDTTSPTSFFCLPKLMYTGFYGYYTAIH